MTFCALAGMQQASWPCSFNDLACRCPIAETYLDCIQSEAETCNNEKLSEVYLTGRIAMQEQCDS